MKFLFVLAYLGAAFVREKAWSKMHFANYAALAVVMFTTLIENLRLCSSAEIVLNSFLNFEQKWASCSNKIVLMKKVYTAATIPSKQTSFCLSFFDPSVVKKKKRRKYKEKKKKILITASDDLTIINHNIIVAGASHHRLSFLTDPN